jgi:hypothetical protein
MTLMLHSGANTVFYDDLRAVTTPAPTDTHVPVPHRSWSDALHTRFSPTRDCRRTQRCHA